MDIDKLFKVMCAVAADASRLFMSLDSKATLWQQQEENARRSNARHVEKNENGCGGTRKWP